MIDPLGPPGCPKLRSDQVEFAAHRSRSLGAGMPTDAETELGELPSAHKKNVGESIVNSHIDTNVN